MLSSSSSVKVRPACFDHRATASTREGWWSFGNAASAPGVECPPGDEDQPQRDPEVVRQPPPTRDRFVQAPWVLSREAFAQARLVARRGDAFPIKNRVRRHALAEGSYRFGTVGNALQPAVLELQLEHAREGVGRQLEIPVDRFGAGILDASGSLDRRRLGDLVFADPDARRDLESIVHPVVQKTIDGWFSALPRDHPFAIADIPLLFETGRAGEFDAVIVTTCAPATQLRRIIERDGVSEEDARLRVAAQLPLEEKVGRADYVIRTDGTPEDTGAQVRVVLDRLTRTLTG